jgi:DNA-binding transcriptional LysR family regulator
MTMPVTSRKYKPANMLGDWDDVRFFLAVARTGSFSAAAAQLNTKQTTVGRRIQALERRLGAKLFDRHRYGMEVTPAARGVLEQAESMMANATAIERHLAGIDDEMSGSVRVAATEGLAADWLVPRLAELRRRHPDIVVHVVAGDELLDLAIRQADLAIRFIRPTSAQLVAARVGALGSALFAAPSYIERRGLPTSLDDLANHDLVDHTGLHGLPAMKLWTALIERSPRVVFRSNSSIATAQAVVAGLGVGIFPAYVKKYRDLVQAPIDLGIARDIWLVSHEETNKSARIRAVIDYIREQFRKDEREWFMTPEARMTEPHASIAA